MVKIIGGTGRALLSYVVNPTARFLLRIGVTANAVTIAGTVGVLIGSYFGAFGHLFWGTVIVTVGALLDSSMDRIADGAVFGAVVYFMASQGNPYGGTVAALLALAAGQVVSY